MGVSCSTVERGSRASAPRTAIAFDVEENQPVTLHASMVYSGVVPCGRPQRLTCNPRTVEHIFRASASPLGTPPMFVPISTVTSADELTPVTAPQFLLLSPNRINGANVSGISPIAPRSLDDGSGARRYFSVLSDSGPSPLHGAAAAPFKLPDAVFGPTASERVLSPSASAGLSKRAPVVSVRSPQSSPPPPLQVSAPLPAAGATPLSLTIAKHTPDETFLKAADGAFDADRNQEVRRESDGISYEGFTGILRLHASQQQQQQQRRSSVGDFSFRGTRSDSTSGDSPVHLRLASQRTRAASTDSDRAAATTRALVQSWDVIRTRTDEFIGDVCTWVTTRHPEQAHLFGTSSLAEQARVMLSMVGEVMTALARSTDVFSTLLEMCALHSRYTVDEEHFRALQSAFIAVLPKYVPGEKHISSSSNSSSGSEAPWVLFWRMKEHLIVPRQSAASGEWRVAEQPRAFLAESRRVMGGILSRKSASDREQFMVSMLQRAVEADPSVETSSYMSDPRMLLRAFNGLVRLLRGSDAKDVSLMLMEGLSLQHSVEGLDAEAMRAFRQPFIDTAHQEVQKAGKSHMWGPRTASSLGAFWDYTTELWEMALLHVKNSPAAAPEERPPGSVEPLCLMFTGIECCAQLWERNPAVMGEAVEAHHRIVRSAIADYGAYEVKTIDDTFVIAAKDALIALKIALAIQLELMRGPITPGFEMVDDVQGSGPAECWRNDSLRVRIGIHYCRDVSAVCKDVQRRYDCKSLSADGAQYLGGVASGGQIVMTQTTLDALREMPAYLSDSPCAEGRVTPRSAADVSAACGAALQALRCDAPPLADMVVVRDWGTRIFEGCAETVRLASLVPTVLAGRVFAAPVSLSKQHVRCSADDGVVARNAPASPSAAAAGAHVEEVVEEVIFL
ncbi:Adenylate and Guanylate cyclase catalytic domain containing protein [Novymonas esmeraldas]|uniref:Adenylate and Guanylate cyclase catalytic domain containing protein n=1 Tax=Novymonas esmeraldas TaxID=1808958 RepID=A0AAW0ET92_9TRYP